MGERQELLQLLLSQHKELRHSIERIHGMISHVEKGKSREATGVLRVALLRLKEEAEHHVDFENHALQPILRDRDAWGQARVQQMEEEHREEHADLLKGLDTAARARSAAALLRVAREITDKLLAHIAEEERLFVNQKVVVEDPFNDYFGG